MELLEPWTPLPPDSCDCALLKQQCTYLTGKTNHCISFDIHFSLCKVNLFQCTGRHLRLIDMCGLCMLKIIIFEKFSGGGLYSGDFNIPEITVHANYHLI